MIDDEVSLRVHLRQIGGERDIMVTTEDIKEGVPEEPPMPILALIVGDYTGKEMDPIIAQASKNLLMMRVLLSLEYFLNSHGQILIILRPSAK